MPFKDQSFGIVICSPVVNASLASEAVREMFRVLRSGGHLILTGSRDTINPLVEELGADRQDSEILEPSECVVRLQKH